LCEQLCPEVFEVQADGVAHSKADTCNTHNISEIVEQCPVSAIKVE
jgi:ferredoxin